MLNKSITVNRSLINAYNDSYEHPALFTVTPYRNCVLEVATFFKLSSVYNCDSAIDAFAVDSVNDAYRFTVVYVVQSSSFNYGLRVITKTKDGLALLSLQSLYPAFNWAEREMWDLSGVFFTKHPDLRRLLTDYGFSGHPLRKDFPISGFKEVHYSDAVKQIAYGDIELSQNYRLSGVMSSWTECA